MGNWLIIIAAGIVWGWSGAFVALGILVLLGWLMGY